mmetsp:Transcript_163942/g.525779  ORF Transcript_163942/g.525779 Transcript_163942/m.525779 type:complete len:1060 (-) Transcript_163942:19-3198(-)
MLATASSEPTGVLGSMDELRQLLIEVVQEQVAHLANTLKQDHQSLVARLVNVRTAVSRVEETLAVSVHQGPLHPAESSAPEPMELAAASVSSNQQANRFSGRPVIQQTRGSLALTKSSRKNKVQSWDVVGVRADSERANYAFDDMMLDRGTNGSIYEAHAMLLGKPVLEEPTAEAIANIFSSESEHNTGGMRTISCPDMLEDGCWQSESANSRTSRKAAEEEPSAAQGQEGLRQMPLTLRSTSMPDSEDSEPDSVLPPIAQDMNVLSADRLPNLLHSPDHMVSSLSASVAVTLSEIEGSVSSGEENSGVSDGIPPLEDDAPPNTVRPPYGKPPFESQSSIEVSEPMSEERASFSLDVLAETERCSYNSSVSYGKKNNVRNLGALDNMVTDRLFQSFGLATQPVQHERERVSYGSRPSFGSRFSFGERNSNRQTPHDNRNTFERISVNSSRVTPSAGLRSIPSGTLSLLRPPQPQAPPTRPTGELTFIPMPSSITQTKAAVRGILPRSLSTESTSSTSIDIASRIPYSVREAVEVELAPTPVVPLQPTEEPIVVAVAATATAAAGRGVHIIPAPPIFRKLNSFGGHGMFHQSKTHSFSSDVSGMAHEDSPPGPRSTSKAAREMRRQMRNGSSISRQDGHGHGHDTAGDDDDDESASRMARRTSTGLGGISGMDALRAEHEDMLVATQANAVPEENMDYQSMEMPDTRVANVVSAPVLVLRAFGLVPSTQGLFGLMYGRFLLLLFGAMFAYTLVQAIRVSGSLYNYLSTACFSLGALLGIVFLRSQRIQDLLGPRRMPLEMYATAFGFYHNWHIVSRNRLAVVTAMYITSAIAKVAGVLYVYFDESIKGFVSEDPVMLVFFLMSSAMLFALIFCMLHVCSCLEMAIDQYCIRFFEAADLSKGIAEWNVLQALLRRAAHTVEVCFLAVSTGVLAVLLLTGVEMFNLSSRDYGEGVMASGITLGLWAMWVLPPTGLVFYAVFRAAAITEKCNRVPALVNSWSLIDEQIDHEKQYTVQYIIQSAAGFYVKGVRLNATWALKLSYFFGVLMFTMLTQSFLSPVKG